MTTHAQALAKLAAGRLIDAIDEDVARLAAKAHAFGRHQPAIAADPGGWILPRLLRRWNCVLQAGDETAPATYRHKTALALAIVLHKYGVADAAMSAAAGTAIVALNDAVALGDDFFRKSDAIATAFLRTPPAPLRRAPAQPDSLTFHRAGDVISIQLDDRFHAAYVHGCARTNESPIIEFYEGGFAHVPGIDALHGRRAHGETYRNGRTYVSRFSVAGMKFLPDFAGQVVLVEANVKTPPANDHLQRHDGEFTVHDIFDLQDAIDRMFHGKGWA